MTSRSIPTIDPGGVAQRLGATGEGIVFAVLGTGIDARHPHFARYANLTLPPPLQHYDLTLVREREREREEHEQTMSDIAIGFVRSTELSNLNDETLSDEALIDRQGFGTHIAAIVAGYLDGKDPAVGWDEDASAMSGVAPRCKLLSLKVIDDVGGGDEFDVLRALEVVMAINARAGKIVVHGVLAALSIPHDVANYACGHTPICDAVDRLVQSGVVVVAAAGNGGYMKVESGGRTQESGCLMTITDPGNAERAITVGSTHYSRAQEYGASYFSARGPTLDGRTKPDLLAPGEKISSAKPSTPAPRSKRSPKSKRKSSAGRSEAEYTVKDGTSMAAAHVAGAVAVLLSARPELIGDPEGVKELLLSTATDLGRPAWFQGRGLVNLSRALGDDAQINQQLPERPASDLTAHAPAPIVNPDTQQVSPVSARPGARRFAVAFSYAGEQRDYVKQVVYATREVGNLPRTNVFYDRFYLSELSRPGLDTYLLDIYGKQSELMVVFLSAEYAKKQWTDLESRVVRQIILAKASHSVMLVRFDQTEIPGLLAIDGYIDAKDRDPEQIADMIVERLQTNRSRGLD